MATTAQATPRDPLRTYAFRIAIEDPFAGRSSPTWIAGVQRVGGLSATVEVNETWEGGNNLHRYATPNRVTWDPITLEQGLALDDTLELWAETVVEQARSGYSGWFGPIKRNLVIDLWNDTTSGPPEPTRRAMRYRVFNSWISRYQPMPRLDAMSSEVGLLMVEIVHEGWTVERTQPPT